MFSIRHLLRRDAQDIFRATLKLSRSLPVRMCLSMLAMLEIKSLKLAFVCTRSQVIE